MKRPFDDQLLYQRVQAQLTRVAGKRSDCPRASVLVRSDRLGIDTLAQIGSGGPDAFHVASVGKLFTAVMVARLVDRGLLHFSDPVAPLLAPGTLDRLFVIDGIDHQHQVTIAQLLSHTSGAADYYADRSVGGRSVSRLIVDQPDTGWTPQDLLQFSREQQSAVARPGAQFHYSDTGYIVLGLVVEALTGTSFTDAVHRDLFEPLGMSRTFFPFRTSPAVGTSDLRPAFLHGKEISRNASITADWAGGGVASTEHDLLRFGRALSSGQLVANRTLAKMEQFDWVFLRGIRYGLGCMQYRFGEWFPLFRSYPKMHGHMGVLGTHLCYDRELDLHIVISLGSDAAVESSVRLLIAVVGFVRRVARNTKRSAAR